MWEGKKKIHAGSGPSGRFEFWLWFSSTIFLSKTPQLVYCSQHFSHVNLETELKPIYGNGLYSLLRVVKLFQNKVKERLPSYSKYPVSFTHILI